MEKEKNGTGERSYIAGLYGLRAIAAIAVVSYHLFTYDVKGGYLGVCLFFVLSGFLLAGKGTLELSRREFSVKEFYFKRFKRIYPSLLIFIFVTYAVFYFLEPQIISGTRSEFLAMVFGYHNWWQILREGSYFSKLTAISPFRHIWSLSMEIQFYVIYPLVFFIFLSLLKRFKKKTALFVFGVITVLSALPMTVAFFAGVDISRIYYGTDLRFFAILFGMLTGFLRVGVAKNDGSKFKMLHEICVYAAFIAMLAAFWFMEGQSDITYICGMQLVCVLMSYIAFEIADGGLSITRVLEFAPLRWIGSRSYEIYLWHYPFVAYLHYHKLLDRPWYVIGALAMSLVTAELAYTVTGVINKRLFGESEKGLFSKGLIVAATVLVVVLGCFITFTVSSGDKLDESELVEELNRNQELLASQDDAAADQVTATDQVTAAEALDETDQVKEDVIPQDEAQPDTALDEASSEETETVEETTPSFDPNSLTFVGDSITLGASPDILEVFPNAYVDAQTSRQVRGSVEILKNLDSEGHLGQNVVILLGVNGPFLEKDAQELIDYLGPDRHIWWVNAYGSHIEWQDRGNEVIAAVAAANDNMTVIDWASEGALHPDWFYEDGVHLNKEGQANFASFLYSNLMGL